MQRNCYFTISDGELRLFVDRDSVYMQPCPCLHAGKKFALLTGTPPPFPHEMPF